MIALLDKASTEHRAPSTCTALEMMRGKGYLVDPKVYAGAYIVRQEMDLWIHD